jgi:hypothetical protein
MKNPQKPKLEETMTSKILPVDLNAYICGNYRTIAILYSEIGSRIYRKPRQNFLYYLKLLRYLKLSKFSFSK